MCLHYDKILSLVLTVKIMGHALSWLHPHIVLDSIQRPDIDMETKALSNTELAVVLALAPVHEK